MWLKGIRYGLEMTRVRAAIKNNSMERLVIARSRLPRPGMDASIRELSNTMHRDHTPKRLADGRVDLSSFSIHFPQIAADARLMKKIPRVLGKPGWNLRGIFSDPGIPKDLNMEIMAGPGTRIERVENEEFIVASISGFLHIDAKSNLISVTEKIVSKQGVNMHTTGNLELSGADYEEHGEVQEKRQVTGHNMTFLANVYGQVVSDGGIIELKSNLAGGAARNSHGSIVIEGTASNATIEANGGEITLNMAQNTLIIGKKVKIQQAVNCEIMAEEVEVENCRGCAVAGKAILIHNADVWKGTESLVTIHLPDPAAWNQRREDLDKQIKANRLTLEGKRETWNKFPIRPKYANFSPCARKSNRTRSKSPRNKRPAGRPRSCATLRCYGNSTSWPLTFASCGTKIDIWAISYRKFKTHRPRQKRRFPA